MRECTVDGCEKSERPGNTGLCPMHYHRRWRHGDVNVTLNPGGPCIIDGCNRRRKARGLCATHYERWRKNGTLEKLPRPALRPAAELTAYSSVHNRLKIERGPASTHACVNCGCQAREWAFDESTGWSTDLTRYRPLCGSCHKRVDRVA